MFLDVEPHLLVSQRLVGVQSAPRIPANSQGLVSTSSWAFFPKERVLFTSCWDTKFIPFSGSRGRSPFNKYLTSLVTFLSFSGKGGLASYPSSVPNLLGGPSCLPFLVPQANVSSFFKGNSVHIQVQYDFIFDPSRFLYFNFFPKRLVPS